MSSGDAIESSDRPAQLSGPTANAFVRLGIVIITTCHFACAPSGDQPTCGSIVIVSPDVTVTDAATGSPICDATVVVLDAPQVESGGIDAAPNGTLNPTNCRYAGSALNYEGVHTLQVSKVGYQTMTVPNVTTYSHSCDDTSPIPAAQVVNVHLTPS